MNEFNGPIFLVVLFICICFAIYLQVLSYRYRVKLTQDLIHQTLPHSLLLGNQIDAVEDYVNGLLREAKIAGVVLDPVRIAHHLGANWEVVYINDQVALVNTDNDDVVIRAAKHFTKERKKK